MSHTHAQLDTLIYLHSSLQDKLSSARLFGGLGMNIYSWIQLQILTQIEIWALTWPLPKNHLLSLNNFCVACVCILRVVAEWFRLFSRNWWYFLLVFPPQPFKGLLLWSTPRAWCCHHHALRWTWIVFGHVHCFPFVNQPALIFCLIRPRIFFQFRVGFDTIVFPKSCFLFVTFLPCQFLKCLSHLCPNNFLVFLVLNLSLPASCLVCPPDLPNLDFLTLGLSWTGLLACWNYFCLSGATFCCGLSFLSFSPEAIESLKSLYFCELHLGPVSSVS